jgi:peptide/nickel transport system substrate-binding protein
VDWLRRRRLPAFFLLVLALASGAAACTTSHAANGTTVPQSSIVFVHGGRVVVAVPSLPSNFNPSTPAGGNRITAEVMEQVWPQTFVTDNELAISAEAGFVEEAEVESISPFTVVYTLNPKAVWSDGVPIGVKDFIYNWREQLQWASQLPDAGLLAGYQAISTITSPDGGSIVVVKFSHPFTEWESLFSNLVPAHIGERYGWVDAFEGFDPGKIVSGGPFEITSFVPGVSLVLSRNPHYWFTPARLSQIVLEVQPAAQTLSSLQVGEVNIAQVPDSPDIAKVVADAGQGGIALTEATAELPTLWQLCFNTTAPLLDSHEFRIGIADSLDLAEVTDDSVGLVDVPAAPYESRLILGAGPQSGSGSSGSGTASSGGSGSGTRIGEYDPPAALSSFRAAGLLPGPNGALSVGGTGAHVTLSLLVPSGNIAVAQAASVVQAELNEIGIRVILRQVSLDTMLATTLPMGEYQMALAPFRLTAFAASQTPVYSGSVLPALPPLASRDRAVLLPREIRAALSIGAGLSPLAAAGTSITGAAGVEPGAVTAGAVTRNVFGLDDPSVETDLSDALTNLNSTDDVTLITAADNELSIDVPTIPLFQVPVDVVHSSDIRAVSESPTWAGVFWDAQAWVIQKSPPIVPASIPSIPVQSTGS